MDFNKQLLDEINSVRLNPSNYADKVLKYKDYFEGNILKIPGIEAGIQTQEGAAAYKEAANALKSAKYTEALIPSKGMCQIANDYLTRIQSTEPDKIDEIDMNEIIEKYGNYEGELSQSMEYGSPTPEQVVISLLVSDGDSSRGYRQSLLNPNFKQIGIARGNHDKYQSVTVILYCTKYKNNDGSPDVEDFNVNKITTDNNGQPLATLSEMIDPERQEEKEEEERLKKQKEEEERKQREEEERKQREEEERKQKEEEERIKKEKEE